MKHVAALAVCLALVACDKKKKADPPAPPAPAPTEVTPPPPPPSPISAPPIAGLTIPNVPPKIGDKVVETNHRTMVAKVEPKPGVSIEVTTTEEREEDREVLAVDGAVITKVKVAYPKFTITESAMGKQKAKPTPTAGKTYLVWRDGGELKATLADGGAVSPEELTMLGKHQKGVGRPDVMQAIFAAHTWKTGEQVAMTPAELAQLAAVVGAEDDDGSELKAMGFALQSADDKVALFTMTLVLEQTSPKGSMKMSMTGSAKIDRNSGRALEVKVSGPFEGEMGMPISGTMDATTSYAY